jgi:aspartyl-tRNA(Asn)/glutamyl-tRNA(Gln) amidotransferase subunit C
MSQISKTDIEHVARLARLKLNGAEEEKFTKEIGEILNYIDELGELKEKDVEPISQIAGLTNVTRKDEVSNSGDRENLLQNAPAQHNGYIKVKQVFE